MRGVCVCWWVLIAVLLAAGGGVGCAAHAADEDALVGGGAADGAGGLVDEPAGATGLFVTRWALLSPAAVDRAVADAAAFGFTDVYVQVRGRADAAHLSRLEPRMEHLAESDFDVLAEAVEAGRRHGVRVHAWMNVLTLWRGERPPMSADHAWLGEPSWRLADGLGRHEPLNPRYVMANPVLTEVQDHLAAVVAEVAGYGVSGVVLDWLWLPESRTRGDRVWPGDALSVEMYGAATRRGRPTDARERERYRAWVGERITMLARRLSAAAGAADVAVVVHGTPADSRARLADAAMWVRQGVADRVVCFDAGGRVVDGGSAWDAWAAEVGADAVEHAVRVGGGGEDALRGVAAGRDAAVFAYGRLFDSADPEQPADAAGRERARDRLAAALAERGG